MNWLLIYAVWHVYAAMKMSVFMWRHDRDGNDFYTLMALAWTIGPNIGAILMFPLMLLESDGREEAFNMMVYDRQHAANRNKQKELATKPSYILAHMIAADILRNLDAMTTDLDYRGKIYHVNYTEQPRFQKVTVWQDGVRKDITNTFSDDEKQIIYKALNQAGVLKGEINAAAAEKRRQDAALDVMAGRFKTPALEQNNAIRHPDGSWTSTGPNGMVLIGPGEKVYWTPTTFVDDRIKVSADGSTATIDVADIERKLV